MSRISLILRFVSHTDHKVRVMDASGIQLGGKGEILVYEEIGSMDRLLLD